MSEQVKQARLARRAAGGSLYGIGCCHMCGYKVPPKALWCSTSCAQEYAEETRQLADDAVAAGDPDQSSSGL